MRARSRSLLGRSSSVRMATLWMAAPFLSLAFLTWAGCGTTAGLPVIPMPSAQVYVAQACAAAPTPDEAATLVVLDWDGGVSRQVPDKTLAPFSVAALDITDPPAGEVMSDEAFRRAVLARTQMILCALEPADVAVIEAEADAFPNATVVHITGDAPFVGGKHIGQSDFDPCNAHPDDAVVIWGGALAARIPPSTTDQWINAFANTIAHEIGHTLGFPHPDEDTLARMVDQPAEEVMRGKVTVAALLSPQHFLLQQESCPGNAPGEGSYRILVDDSSE